MSILVNGSGKVLVDSNGKALSGTVGGVKVNCSSGGITPLRQVIGGTAVLVAPLINSTSGGISG